MELFQCRLAAEGVDPLAYGVRHLAEPGVENIENRLAGILEEAFLAAVDETFLETFLKALLEGEFFEEGDVGHGFVG